MLLQRTSRLLRSARQRSFVRWKDPQRHSIQSEDQMQTLSSGIMATSSSRWIVEALLNLNESTPQTCPMGNLGSPRNNDVVDSWSDYINWVKIDAIPSNGNFHPVNKKTSILRMLPNLQMRIRRKDDEHLFRLCSPLLLNFQDAGIWTRIKSAKGCLVPVSSYSDSFYEAEFMWLVHQLHMSPCYGMDVDHAQPMRLGHVPSDGILISSLDNLSAGRRLSWVAHQNGCIRWIRVVALGRIVSRTTGSV
ncbi:hypothetical protein EV363DRAFT_652115 [Boletus edulis]|nr:hypothetical protein EV363DRAFT_652115 [Boletus edulis]